MENIIKKAIEGGYKMPCGKGLSSHGIPRYCKKEDLILDPLFWQALGKSCGWKEKYKHRIKNEDRPALKCLDCDTKPMVGDGNCYGNISNKNEWETNALRFHEINLTQSWDEAVKWLESITNN